MAPFEKGHTMNRIKALLAALAALLMVGALTAPANAYATTVARTYNGSTYVDNAVFFAKQGDGTGVYVDWTALSTNACSLGRFETSGAKWRDLKVTLNDGDSGYSINNTNYGTSTLCNPEMQFNKNGWDVGYVTVTVGATANFQGNDVRFGYVWDLYPSGNTVLVYAGIDYVPEG